MWEFESAAESIGIARPSSAEFHDLCRQVAAFTAELFHTEPAIKLKNDPEIPSDLYFVFTIAATRTVDDLAARYDQWHRRLMRTEGRHALFRLAIDRQRGSRVDRQEARLSPRPTKRGRHNLASTSFKHATDVAVEAQIAKEIVDGLRQCRAEPAFCALREKLRIPPLVANVIVGGI